MNLDITPTNGACGAIVRGIDLRIGRTKPLFAEILS